MQGTRNVIVILGPTASGKSDLGIRLARQFNGVVLSADSRQVYRGLNLGTGKVTRKEMAGVRHELLDIASPRGQYSVSRFVRDALSVIWSLPPEQPIFLVGGSPFYIDALIKPGSYSHVPPDETLRRRLAGKSNRQLLSMLRRLNPSWAATVDAANRRRLIRAIEVSRSKQTRPEPARPLFRVQKIGIRMTWPKLFIRIDQRVDRRMRAGMMREITRLRESGISWRRLDAFGLEYRYLSRIARGQLSRSDGIRQLKSAIHDFSRRQMTWWRRDPDIIWIEKPGTATKIVRNFLATR